MWLATVTTACISQVRAHLSTARQVLATPDSKLHLWQRAGTAGITQTCALLLLDSMRFGGRRMQKAEGACENLMPALSVLSFHYLTSVCFATMLAEVQELSLLAHQSCPLAHAIRCLTHYQCGAKLSLLQRAFALFGRARKEPIDACSWSRVSMPEYSSVLAMCAGTTD